MTVHEAVFLDKDGTLVEDVPYNVDVNKVPLTPGAGPSRPALQSAGYRLVIISNQSGVARGYFREQALLPVRARLEELLAAHGVRVDGVYWCPHHPQGEVAAYAVPCDCRK